MEYEIVQGEWDSFMNDGNEYFVKKFLSPVYPGEKAPGSEKGKQNRRDQCDKFAMKQLLIHFIYN